MCYLNRRSTVCIVRPERVEQRPLAEEEENGSSSNLRGISHELRYLRTDRNRPESLEQGPAEVWAIRTHLQLAGRTRDLALFNLALDSKLRGCDLVRLRVSDLTHGGRVVARAAVVQQKTGMPVRFEVTEQTRTAIRAWVESPWVPLCKPAL